MIIKKYKTKIKNPTIVAVIIVAVFAVFQVMEFSNGATDTVTLTLTVSEALALDCGANVNISGSFVPGTPAYNSSTCTVGTNSLDGYNLQVKRNDGDTTMDNDADASANITDRLVWDPTANSGDGNASTWTLGQTNLGFSVYASTATKDTDWWGTGTACDDALNKYAGFPSTDTNIMQHPSYSASDTTTSVCYKVDTAATQKAGAYTGIITYTASGTP